MVSRFIVFFFFVLFRSFSRFPFYYWIKIGTVLWISSPPGSTFIYKRVIQPLLKEREQVNCFTNFLCQYLDSSLQEIDQLIEHTKQQSYSAILDLTNKGFRYASNVFLNTAVLVR